MKLGDFDKSGDGDYQSPKERIPMIKEVFELVLGREPSSRELSFYKYGIQTKEEIIEKLLSDEDHKKVIDRANEYSQLEDRAKNAEHQVVKLKQNLKDVDQEQQQLRSLLDEKNKEIAILRKENSDPYNFTHSNALKYIQSLTANSRENQNNQTILQSDNHFSSISSQKEPIKESFIDKIYKLLKLS
jgi:hypothetical protein